VNLRVGSDAVLGELGQGFKYAQVSWCFVGVNLGVNSSASRHIYVLWFRELTLNPRPIVR